MAFARGRQEPRPAEVQSMGNVRQGASKRQDLERCILPSSCAPSSVLYFPATPFLTSFPLLTSAIQFRPSSWQGSYNNLLTDPLVTLLADTVA